MMHLRYAFRKRTSYMMIVMNKQANDDGYHLSWIGQ